jgi:hypothetical protein
METKELKVSPQIQNFIECVDMVNKLWNLLYKALVFQYTEKQAQCVIEDEYNDIHDKVMAAVSKFMVDSIQDKLMDNKVTEI